ncbi:retrovirus-related Pol polyprotein from transposon 17.6 [Trichonephila clavipes]|nr:retrovirus-related Pol polyprotein from transposon 17.6 [Trichonephila clavipes]
MCQINNYKNALPAGRLIPIVSKYPNEIVKLDLLGPYPVSRVRRNRYVLVITDHFSKWAEIIPLKKASARVITDNFFDNYISRFGAPSKLISDNGPQFISDIFENLSEREIRHKVRKYRHRKCDETEIGTGNSDNGSLRDESSDFDKVQRRSNDSRDGKKKGKKSRREETVAPTTSGYNLRPRIGKREESRPTIERKTQQGRPVRSRKGREKNDSPYIEDRTRSSNKNARRGGDQQRIDQERRGTCTKKSLSLEVLVGNANYKS